MKIIYLAKHNSGGNNDEDAVAHGFRELGHTVHCIAEHNGRNINRLSGDFLLFHKWSDVNPLKHIHCPKVFYYFDLVDFPDPSLHDRCKTRMEWMRTVVPHVDLGFCTDGDWVERDKTSKLIHLPQGADERVIGMGKAREQYPKADILFTGIKGGGGKARESFVSEMIERYGDRFLWIDRKFYGRDLADLIAGCKIVVAPDEPTTDLYCSNRIFITLGFGGFLLHPYVKFLADGINHPRYHEGVVWYHNRDELHRLIEYYLKWPDKRRDVSVQAIEETKRSHLYRHRCEVIINTVKRLKCSHNV